MRDEPERRAVLARRATRQHDGLAERGHARPDWGEPRRQLPAGDADQRLRAWRALLEAGVFTAPFMPPAVPPGQSLLRLSVTAAHTEAHVDRIVEVAGELLPAGGRAGEVEGPARCPA
ncbi:hypothetical protein [Streptomyces kanasensis]|uniref:hypothetical protein n=1 Tax=Streptomyces kanasensis TaxID=936756 RepID=UPI0036F6AB45